MNNLKSYLQPKGRQHISTNSSLNIRCRIPHVRLLFDNDSTIIVPEYIVLLPKGRQHLCLNGCWNIPFLMSHVRLLFTEDSIIVIVA